MSKERLLIFTDCYIYGGSERLMSFLVKNEVLMSKYEINFAFRAHDIYKRGMLDDFCDFSGKIIPVPLMANETIFYELNRLHLSDWIKNLIKTPFWLLKKLGVYTIFNSIFLLSILKKERPEILHINNGGFPGAASCNLLVFLAKFTSVRKIVYQVNNQAQKNTIFNKKRNAQINEYVSSFVTSSNMAKNNLSHNAGMEINKIHIVRNIVQLNPITLSKSQILKNFRLPTNTFILTNVAFLTKRKGQIYLLKALKKWLDAQTTEINICLFLIGDGEDYTLLLNYCQQNDLKKYVHFLGYQSNYADYINAADLVVFPSISDEDLPLVIIESLMLGKCILGTALAGISEVIIDENNGVLVNPDVLSLVDDLSAKIDFLYSKPDEIMRLAQGAKISSENFSETRYGEKLDNIYKYAK
ncbi:MAG TPA: glycosyltransferase [Pelobium sp.]|nr:glycosyltransferase [Pelobium sp.]